MLLSAAFGAAHADDRSIAEWVIREGGSVVLAGHSQQVRELRELPSSEFQLKSINLVDTNYLAQDVQRIGTLPHLKHLYMSGRTRRPFSLKVKTTKIYEDGEDRELTDGWVFSTEGFPISKHCSSARRFSAIPSRSLTKPLVFWPSTAH